MLVINQPPSVKVGCSFKECVVTLSQERIGQIAFSALSRKMEEDGIRLNPKGVKRDIANQAKALGVTPREIAEFAKIVFKEAYEKTIAELDSIK